MFCLVVLVLCALHQLLALESPDSSEPSYSVSQFGRMARQPGCPCTRSSLHNHLCNFESDFVIKAKILDVSSHQQALIGYQILVKDIYHLPPADKLKVGDRVALYTPAGEDFCGTSFIRKQTYLLTGRILDNILIVTKCDYSRKWATITTTIQRALQVLPHKRHCACKVFGCNNDLCGTSEEWDVFRVFETTKCIVKRDTLKERCYEDYGQCRMSNRGTCAWRSQKKPKVCMNVARRRWRNTDT